MANITKIEGKKGVSYKITVSCGYDIKGNQKRYYKTWTPREGMTARQIEKELQRQALHFEDDVAAGKVSESNIKFEAFAQQWFQEVAAQRLKERTIDSYRRAAPRIYAALGHLRVNDITTRTVQKLINNLCEDGMNERTGGRLSAKSVKNYIAFVSSVFNYAVAQGVTSSNPCRGVSLPAASQSERDCYTLEEAQQLLELLEHEPIHWRSFFTLAIYGGLRRGELFGLEWKDIDFDTNVITIQRNSLYTPGRGVYTDTPKTARSQRFIKLPREVIELLKEHRTTQNIERLKVGDRWRNSDRLFVGIEGQPMNPGSAQCWFTTFCERTGMRHINVHSFRHLNASLLINTGTDVRTVSAMLGHAQTSTTLNIYAHTFAEAQAQASEAVAERLSLGKNKTINAK